MCLDIHWITNSKDVEDPHPSSNWDIPATENSRTPVAVGGSYSAKFIEDFAPSWELWMKDWRLPTVGQNLSMGDPNFPNFSLWEIQNLGCAHKDKYCHPSSNKRIPVTAAGRLSTKLAQDLQLAQIFARVRWSMIYQTCLREIQTFYMFETSLLYQLTKTLLTILSILPSPNIQHLNFWAYTWPIMPTLKYHSEMLHLF